MPNLTPTMQKYAIGAAIAVVVLILGGVLVYQYQAGKRSEVANTGGLDDTKALVVEVSKVFDLPVGEEPTIATVKDVDKLKSEPFFQKAKNGDKVLIYSMARKIILYDPTAKRVLDVAPFNPGSTPSAQIVSPPPSPSP